VAEAFISEIRIVGFNFPPRGWAFCNGQTLAINQNQALFSLLGTTFGGNGVNNFQLPNLQGRVPIHFGQGPGRSNYVMGQQAGSESVTLIQGQMPQHNHQAFGTSATGNAPTPAANYLGVAAQKPYQPFGGGMSQMNPGTISNAGGSQPHNNMQPYLAIYFCICLQGVFPSRN